MPLRPEARPAAVGDPAKLPDSIQGGDVQDSSLVVQNVVQNRGRAMWVSMSISARQLWVLQNRGLVHTVVLAAGITVVASSALAQLAEMPSVTRLLPVASSAEGIGNPFYEGMLDPTIAVPVGLTVEVSSAAGISSSNPAMINPALINPGMIAVAQPGRPALNPDGCPMKGPTSVMAAAVTVTPDAPSTYVALSSHCKLQIFLHRAYSPYMFASAAYEAGIAQMSAQWPQYGGGMQGWGKRFGATLADTESRRFIQTYVLSTVLHQDPRYFYSTKTSLIGRAWYAATRVIITRGDNGRSEFNASEILGALSTSALQNAYYPQHYRNVNDTLGRFTGSLSSDATSAILREFTPDLKRLFDHYCPRNLQRLEARLPIPDEDKP